MSRHDSLGEPPPRESSRTNLDRPTAKPDNRKTPRTGRTEQFQIRVRPADPTIHDAGFGAEYDGLRGRKTRGEFLEELITLYKAKSGDSQPFGLSANAHRLAKMIAKSQNTDDLGLVIETALHELAKKHGLVKKS